ncbi:MAG: NAD(P)/FAD-dependent oxidoreductase [Bacteroidota bacterium]|nr:NAD(P)/FAD-dependent oxidoreductase [Bacteroidota bacterium]
MDKKENVVIIGGGAAGMIAAWRAASLGAQVTLLEKNPNPGIKILISGGGKCNITNGNEIQTMLKQFQKNESRFLKFAFHTFTNDQLLTLLQNEGVETYTRDNGKVFPTSHDAEDVVKAFQNLMERNGVEVLLQTPVKEIFRNDDGSFNVKTNRGIISAAKVIIATGGSSYQKTGTTGDGFRWIQKLGHTIVPIRPALTPIILLPAPPSLWQGTPIRECNLMAISLPFDFRQNNGGQAVQGEIVSEWRGDVLITHFGISGPATLEVSRNAYLQFEKGIKIDMCVDFYPELTIEQLDEKIIKEISTNPSRSMITLTEYLVPQKLAEFLLAQLKIDYTKKLNQLSKNERGELVKKLKRFPLGTVKDIPLDRGEVTAGGASLNEVDSTTMESTIVQGLYLCGEVLDIAGPVGGYNLQAAFSTGYVAGDHAATSLR